MTKEIWEPQGTRFWDAASDREMLLVDEPERDFDGWLCYRHPDGQWVSLRKATEEDFTRLLTMAERDARRARA